MGPNSRSRYRDVEMPPGRYMPKEMREICRELYRPATRFAEAAREGDLHQTPLACH